MIQKAKVIIGPNNILQADFTSNPKDNMSNKDKGKSSNLKLPKNKIKNKDKGNKQISDRKKKPLI